MEFQKLVAEALLSNYGRADVFNENPTLRLATAVVNRSELMSEAITTKGHTFHFESSDIENSPPKDSPNSVRKAPDFGGLKLDDDKPEAILEVRQVQDHPELEGLVYTPEKLAEPHSRSIQD